MATKGLLQWANAVRLTMETDPGRALFKEQVQTHGFSFLDGYLDSILLNAKQDALIELVKTPGRKRTLTKKSKLASKLREGVVLFSEDESHCKTIPQDNAEITHPSSEQHQSIEELSMQTLQVKGSSTVLAQATPCDALPVSTTTCPSMEDPLHSSHSEAKELSMIAEDDEMAERSRVSFLLVDSIVAQNLQAEATVDHHSPQRNTKSPTRNTDRADEQDSSDKIHDNTQSTSIDANVNVHNQDNHIPSTNDSDTVKRKCKMVEDGGPVVPEPQSSTEDCAEDVIVPLRGPDSVPPSPKANGAPFPPLPAAAPLRKSMRTMENSTVVGSLGAVTPGVPVAGKRTSWLQKVRQAKAMEIASKKTPSILSGASSLQSSSTILLTDNPKRKSMEAFNGYDDERRHKVAKTTETDIVAANIAPLGPVKRTPPLSSEAPQPEGQEGGMLDLLKKMVEGHNARAGKSMGKSLGGSAVTALAEARAAAEARIAERNVKENETMTVVHTASKKSNEVNEGQVSLSKSQPMASERSDPSSQSRTVDSASTVVSSNSLKSAPVSGTTETVRECEGQSVSTTPPNTPPTVKDVFIPPPGPVFNKPPPVFVPPSKNLRDVAQIEKSILSTSKNPPPTRSTLESMPVFDNDRNLPAWMLSTQDTYAHSQNTNVCDEDDSWPIDEKLAEGVHWIYGDEKDDNTTWSSLPSQPNTANLSEGTFRSAPEQGSSEMQHHPTEEHIGVVLDVCDTDMDQKEIGPHVNTSDSEMEEVTQNATMNTVSLVESSKSQSQMSNSFSSSQQSQAGFFGQATKLIGNIMGSGKKAKPEVQKVLQRAAIAAKKQQEESDKKAARLKEMENRRQLAIQRKAEEEKARVMEQEKKIKEDSDRRKREREEHTEKRPLKAPSGRKDDDTAKKRKIEIDKEVKNSINPLKPAAKPALKQPSALTSSATYNTFLNTSGAPALKSIVVKSNAFLTAKAKGKMPVKAPTAEEDLPLPSQIVQTQMAARAKAQLQAAKQAQDPLVPSENIELPDINSEYSDSEDEDRKRTFDPPEWAQSPELRQALQQQSTINPDDIFGAIRPLRMEEIFKTRTSRFRARTSSANWAGSDRLTIEEEREYARRMGFR